MNALVAKDLETLNKKRPKKDLLVLETLDQPLSKNLLNDLTPEMMAAGLKVRVIVNLTRTKKGHSHAVFSIYCKGKVVAHAYYVEMKNCKFIVSEKQRQYSIKTKSRYVHAFVEGDLVSFSQVPCSVKGDFDNIASYNPFKGPNFYDVRTGGDIPETADTVHMFGRCAHTRRK